jgi:hypothetical protein
MRAFSGSVLFALLLCCGGNSGPLPPAPTTLTAQAQPDGGVLLQWDGPPEATGFRVFAAPLGVAIESGRSVHVPATGASTYAFVLTGLSAGLTYHFAVAALNSNGQGPLSAEAIATLQ